MRSANFDRIDPRGHLDTDKTELCIRPGWARERRQHQTDSSSLSLPCTSSSGGAIKPQKLIGAEDRQGKTVLKLDSVAHVDWVRLR